PTLQFDGDIRQHINGKTHTSRGRPQCYSDLAITTVVNDSVSKHTGFPHSEIAGYNNIVRAA
ncbi:hypothetical protein O5286_29430, partial [Escherichia coli]|nr:hypothetical protein [Escherichia coli]